MPAIYLYSRFSTPEQAAGDSYDRQMARAREYAERHSLSIDQDRSYHDAGMSGWTGAHVKNGRLGEFLQLVELGAIERGSWLLIEDWDRFSRMGGWDSLPFVVLLINSGVRIVELSSGQEFDRQRMRSDPLALTQIQLSLERGKQESGRKSDMLLRRWSSKRTLARDGGHVLTTSVPKWLRVVDANGNELRERIPLRLRTAENEGRFEVIPERAAVVLRIYDLAATGHGLTRIATALNQDRVPTFGGGKAWTPYEIRRMIHNLAVIGLHQPKRIERAPEGEISRKDDGKPIEGYFPPIVPRELWDAVQAASGSPLRGKAFEVHNPFSGLLQCGRCGSSLRMVAGGARKDGSMRRYLRCRGAIDGRQDCPPESVRLDRFERAFADALPAMLREAPAGQDLQDQLDAARLNVLGISDVIDDVARDPKRREAAVLRALGEALHEAGEEVSRLEAKVEETSDVLVRHRLDQLREKACAEPWDRQALNLTLRAALTRIVVEWDIGEAVMQWRHGGAGSFQWAVGAEFPAGA